MRTDVILVKFHEEVGWELRKLEIRAWNLHLDVELTCQIWGVLNWTSAPLPKINRKQNLLQLIKQKENILVVAQAKCLTSPVLSLSCIPRLFGQKKRSATWLLLPSPPFLSLVWATTSHFDCCDNLPDQSPCLHSFDPCSIFSKTPRVALYIDHVILLLRILQYFPILEQKPKFLLRYHKALWPHLLILPFSFASLLFLPEFLDKPGGPLPWGLSTRWFLYLECFSLRSLSTFSERSSLSYLTLYPFHFSLLLCFSLIHGTHCFIICTI